MTSHCRERVVILIHIIRDVVFHQAVIVCADDGLKSTVLLRQRTWHGLNVPCTIGIVDSKIEFVGQTFDNFK